MVKWDCEFYTYFLCTWASCSQWAQRCVLHGGPVEGTWREKLSRSIRALGKHFTWPQPGLQHSGQCHSCSWICCQVQNCWQRLNRWSNKVSWFPAPRMQGGFHCKVFLASVPVKLLSVMLLLLLKANSLQGKTPFPVPNNVFHKYLGLCRQVAFS